MPNGTAPAVPAVPADIAQAITSEVLSLLGHLDLGWQTREFTYSLTINHTDHDGVPGTFTLASGRIPVRTAVAS